jgi:hypothetical protein
MSEETPEQAAERRRAFVDSEEGRRLIDAFAFLPPALRPRLLEMMESFRRWRDG